MKKRNITQTDDWATPKYLYDELDKEFNFDYDPCPLGGANVFGTYDEACNGGGLDLSTPWGKRNFINPPYSRTLKQLFVRRALKVAQGGALCVLLLPVSTSTALFHDLIKPNAKEIRFIRGRISFLGINSKGEYVTDKKPMHDSMLVVFDGRK